MEKKKWDYTIPWPADTMILGGSEEYFDDEEPLYALADVVKGYCDVCGGPLAIKEDGRSITIGVCLKCGDERHAAYPGEGDHKDYRWEIEVTMRFRRQGWAPPEEVKRRQVLSTLEVAFSCMNSALRPLLTTMGESSHGTVDLGELRSARERLRTAIEAGGGKAPLDDIDEGLKKFCV